MKTLLTSLRLVVATLLVCSIAYPLLLLGFAKVISPHTAEGSLVYGSDGRIIGSRLIAQAFTAPRYFWPRPSAVDYNGAGAGGSNLSPTNPALAERAQKLIAQYDAGVDRPLPADLVTASGSGLDPNISYDAAEYQVPRIAAARQIPESLVGSLVENEAVSVAGPLAPSRIVNVLELNLALDTIHSQP